MTTEPPQLLGAGEGESIRPGLEFKIGRPELVMTETRFEPNKIGTEPHVHHHHADAFYVLEGELLVTLGHDELALHKGAFALMAPDVVHGFRTGSLPARYLNVHAPGMGFDDYLRGLRPDFDQHEPPADGAARCRRRSCMRPLRGPEARSRRFERDDQGRWRRRARLLRAARVRPGARLPGTRPPPPRAHDRQLLRARRRVDAAPRRRSRGRRRGQLCVRPSGQPALVHEAGRASASAR